MVLQGVQVALYWWLRVQQQALQPPQPEVWPPLAGSLQAVLTMQGNPQRLKTASTRRLKTH